MFLISAQNIDCGYSLEPPRRAPTIYVFEQKFEKYQNFSSENFHFFGGKTFSIFEYACFRNAITKHSPPEAPRRVEMRFK